MKHLTVFLLVFLETLHIAAQNTNHEYGVLEEYKGRERRTAISGVDVSAKGSNPTVTDNNGLFTLEFGKETTTVDDFDFDKEGYVIFNKDAVNQWRIANNIRNRFHVVVCRQRDLRDKINEYYNIFDTEYKEVIEKKKKEIEKLKYIGREKDEQLRLLDEEYKRLQREAREKAERYARIDENALQEVEYKALCLFRENKSSEALKLLDEYQLKEKVEKKKEAFIEARNKALEQKEDLARFIPTYSLYIDGLKLGGQRNEDSLIVMLNSIVDIYHQLSDTIYNQSLALCLYDLGCIHEPIVDNYLSSLLDGGKIHKMEARHQDIQKAQAFFLEASALGYAPAQYKLGKLYETGIYDLHLSKKYYTLAAKQGYRPAIDRLDDFVDFGQRDAAGNMIYYHIKETDGKKGKVKVTYRDISYATYKGFQDQLNDYNSFGDVIIPSNVSHNGIKYDIVEIGRNAFRLSGVKRLVIPEGVDTLNYYALRSTHDLEEIYLPKSLKYIDRECIAWHTGLKRIEINPKNKSFYKDDKGNLYSENEHTIVLALDNPNVSWSEEEKTHFVWTEKDPYPVSITHDDIFAEHHLKMAQFPSVNIPVDVDTIPEECFNNSRLKTLTIPSNVKEIMDEAFSYCGSLHDLLLPKSLVGLRTWSFQNCDLLSEVYSLSPIPHHIDINTFEEGPVIRYLHVPKGTKELYQNAQGWNSFDHIIDDISEEHPLYDAIVNRANGKYREAINSIDDQLKKPNVLPVIKAQGEIQKAMLYYQIGEEDNVYTSAMNAIIPIDMLSSVEDDDKLDRLLNYNLIAISIGVENDSLSSLLLPQLSEIYNIALDRDRFAITEFSDKIISELNRRFKYDSKQVGKNVFNDVKANNLLCMLCLKSDSINKKDSFCKDQLTDFAETAVNLLKTSCTITQDYISNVRKNINAGAVLEKEKIQDMFEAFLSCYSTYVELYAKVNDEDLAMEMDSVEVILFKTMSNISYISQFSEVDSPFSDELSKYVYDWCVENLSKAGAETILKDICSFSGFDMPTSYSEIPLLIQSLEENIIPESVDLELTENYVKTAQYAYEEGLYVDAISYFCKAAHVSGFALRRIGLMCYYGQGIGKNCDYALKLLEFAAQKDDLNWSKWIQGVIYKELGDSQKAFESFSKSSVPLAKMNLAQMYKTGEYVTCNMDKAIELYMEVLNSDDERMQEKAEKAIQYMAEKLNHMAYEEVHAYNNEQALVYISKAHSLLPESADIMDSYGEIYYIMGQKEKAIAFLKKAIELQPDVIERSSLYNRLRLDKLI